MTRLVLAIALALALGVAVRPSASGAVAVVAVAALAGGCLWLDDRRALRKEVSSDALASLAQTKAVVEILTGDLDALRKEFDRTKILIPRPK